jgi:uncharacterized membrane protein
MNKILDRHKKLREELRSRLEVDHTWMDSVADFLTVQFGTVWFFSLNATFFVVWILLNSGFIPGEKPFDQYPFNFLTMVVSLEAIFLSVIVLISQNKQGKVADMREQIDLEVNVRAEEEVTKVLVITEQIARHLGIALARDPELKEMEERTDIHKIRDRIEQDR